MTREPRDTSLAPRDVPGAVRRAQPDDIEPQLASAAPPGAGTWLFERKLDGIRMLLHVQDGEVRLQSRNDQPYAARLPGLAQAVAAAASVDLVADAELVAHDGEVTSFSLLQARLGSSGHARDTPLNLYLFDVLHLDGYDLRAVPLLERKELLREAISFVDPLRFTEHVTATTAQSADLLDRACDRGWEGLIAKDPRSRYRSGRTQAWRKLPCLRTDAFVVGGFTRPGGSRAGFGALHLGYHDEHGDLRYAGKVGTGFGEQQLAVLQDFFARIEAPDPPFVDPPRDRDSRWVRPIVVVEVTYTEWTAAGRLRHPRFLAVLTDRAPQDVGRAGDS